MTTIERQNKLNELDKEYELIKSLSNGEITEEQNALHIQLQKNRTEYQQVFYFGDKVIDPRDDGDRG